MRLRWLVACVALWASIVSAGAFWQSRDSNYNVAISTGGGGTATPVMFQHITTSTNPVGNGITGRTPIFKTEALPPNTTAILAITVPVVATTATVSDTLAGAWGTAVCTATGGSGNYKVSIFVQGLGATGGTDTITISFGATNRQPFQYNVTFFQNLDTVADGSFCSASPGLTPSAGGVITPTAFTPTTSNNANGGHVIWNYTAICGNAASNASNWTPASGFSLLNGEVIWTNLQGFPQASQYQVQTTNASVTASITATGENASGDCFNSATVAVKVVNNSATPPSTIHVAAIFHESWTSITTPGTVTVQIPFTGNLRVLTATWPQSAPNGPAVLSTVNSSDGCNFTNNGASAGLIWHAQNCSPCPTCTVAMAFTGTSTQPQTSFRFYDVQNALASSYQNTGATSGGVIACGTTVTAAMAITPTGAASGLTIAAFGNGNGPITSVTSPAGEVFDLWTFTGINDTDVGDNADFNGHLYYSSTATQTYSFTKTNGADQCYGSVDAYN